MSSTAAATAWERPIAACSSQWEKDYTKSLEDFPFFVPDKIHGTNNYWAYMSIDNYVRNVKETLKNPPDLLTIENWLEIFRNSFEEDPNLDNYNVTRVLAVCLALTGPVALFPAMYWNNKALITTTNKTTAWIASYYWFGMLWKNRDSWFEKRQIKSTQTKLEFKKGPQESTKEKSSLKTTKGQQGGVPRNVAFQNPYSKRKERDNFVTPPQSLKNKSHMFLKKQITLNPNNINKLKDHSRKNRTFLKIKLAKVTAEAITDQEDKIATSFNNIMDRLWSIDQGALVLPWKEDSIIKPLRQTSDGAKTKDQLGKFVDRLWVEKNRNPFCHILVAHDTDKNSLFNDEKLQQWLVDNQVGLSIERIQAQWICKAGHLMGYHAQVVNTSNLADAIELHPLMRGWGPKRIRELKPKESTDQTRTKKQ